MQSFLGNLPHLVCGMDLFWGEISAVQGGFSIGALYLLQQNSADVPFEHRNPILASLTFGVVMTKMVYF